MVDQWRRQIPPEVWEQMRADQMTGRALLLCIPGGLVAVPMSIWLFAMTTFAMQPDGGGSSAGWRLLAVIPVGLVVAGLAFAVAGRRVRRTAPAVALRRSTVSVVLNGIPLGIVGFCLALGLLSQVGVLLIL